MAQTRTRSRRGSPQSPPPPEERCRDSQMNRRPTFRIYWQKEQKRTGFAGMSGQRAALPWSLSEPLACALIVTMSGGSCVKQVGAVKNQSSAPRNARKKPSSSGMKSVGQR